MKVLLPHAPTFSGCWSRLYVERSVGFVGHDIDRGCFMTGAPLWIPAFAGMTGSVLREWREPMTAWWLIFLCHSREGGNPLGPTVIHTGFFSWINRIFHAWVHFFRRIHHRAIKQVCHIEHFQVRSEQPVRNHIFAAILAFVYLQKMQMAREFMDVYQHQRELFKGTVDTFVESFAKGKEHFQPKLARAINA